MENAIHFLVQFEQQLRVFHWQTLSYARHKAYGKAYAQMGDFIDAFVESYMGKYGRFNVKPTILKNMDSEDQIEGLLNSFIKGLDTFDSMFQNDPDLLNLKDEILQLATKLKYLITLQ
jgi:hypothetical protein